MDCQEANLWLDSMNHGDLTEPDSSELEGHLAKCSQCSLERDQARRLDVLLERASLGHFPEGFFDRQRQSVMARLGPELEWHAPPCSLLFLVMVIAGYFGGSIGPFMDSVLSFKSDLGAAWASVDEIAPLYGLLLLLAFGAVARDPDPEPVPVEVSQ